MLDKTTADGHVPSVTQDPHRQSDLPVAWILAALLRGRRMLVTFTVIGMLVSVVTILLRPIQYSSTFSFIPQTPQGTSQSGLAAIAGQLGLPLGVVSGPTPPPQLYADLLETREVLRSIAADSFAPAGPGSPNVGLAEFLRVRGSSAAVVEERTIDKLRGRVISASVAARTTGAVNVRVTTESPHVSLAVSERLLAGLNRFNLVTRQSQASEERRFVEERLSVARTSLRAAEDAVQRFLQANRVASSPQLTFEQQRLQREVNLQQQVVTGLAQQYEDARIREVRDTPVITVMERPALPVLPDPRHRVRTLVLGAFAAFVLGTVWVLVREGWKRQRSREGADPSYAMLSAEWASVRRGHRASPDGP